MHPYSAEIFKRFPELPDARDDEDLPYLMGGDLVDWLASLAKLQLSAAVIRRVVDFHNWCMSQPRGEDAGDDIMTIQAVGFFENVFEHDELLPLILHLTTRRELIDNREYLVNWVGQARYDAALKLMSPIPKKHQKKHGGRR